MKYFTPVEFRCKHCGEHGVKTELVDALDELRELVGRPVIITSGYRCPEHPESVKRPGSWHIKGLAADIRCPGLGLRELYGAVLQIKAFRGIGVSVKSGYIHVDVRPNTRVYWRYGAKGAVIAWNGRWETLIGKQA